MENLASYIDHTLLKAEASAGAVRKLCEEARQYGFASVCVNSCRVPLCVSELKGSGVAVCTVVGFPLGAMSTEAKAFEAKQALEAGAREIDMVMNLGAFRDEDYSRVEEDIREVKKMCGSRVLKVILE
ncbi:MAG TPA: deoxyribose-phosphate aldolase, partial [Synergistaceae bacterium]|nr:deoxyribose-phosphate aldolase [Synergistaceae bacterium]